MVTYVVDLKKLSKLILRLLRRFDVPEHFSKSKNEQYSLHQMLILFVLCCLSDQPIDQFELEFAVNDYQEYYKIIESLKQEFPYVISTVDTVLIIADEWTPGFKNLFSR